MKDNMKLEDRFSNKVELFLKDFGIEWIEPYGYVRDYNEDEGGKPCSLQFIQSMEKLMYKYKNGKVITNSGSYYDESTVARLMAEAVEIHSIEVEHWIDKQRKWKQESINQSV